MIRVPPNCRDGCDCKDPNAIENTRKAPSPGSGAGLGPDDENDDDDDDNKNGAAEGDGENGSLKVDSKLETK